MKVKVNTEELKELSDKDLKERLDKETRELDHMRINHTITPLDNPDSLKHKRKNIARIHTELRVRQLNKA